ncbi:MAG: InlB B-repeat-containing protein [Bacilli bacterium]|nr:InlB B-repeat-containing protein [Bacilli bacterium]
MKRRKINKKFIIIVLILFISIGFAYLTSNLNLTGLAIIKRSVWDVHFENIVNENENVLSINTPAQITNNKLRVDFEVTLDQPGEEYSFYVDVLNNSTFDVALSNLSITGLDSSLEDYIIPTVTYSDGITPLPNDILKENSLETLRVSLKYNDDLDANNLPTSDSDFQLSVQLTYIQADNNSKERNHLEYINRQTPGGITVGDEIAIGDEHFYVVSTNEEKTALLAKYNLFVGEIYSNMTTKDRNIQPTEEGYGIQNSTAKGVNSELTSRIGTVAFSRLTYWLDEEIINSAYYDETNTPQVYDETYNASTGNNYSIAYHVINYNNYLKGLGFNTIKARLLSLQEMLDVGCTINSCSDVATNKQFIYSTSYWLQTLSTTERTKVYQIISSTKECRPFVHTYNYGVGVRPVIEVDTDYLKKDSYKIIFDSNGGNAVTPAHVIKNKGEILGDKYYRLYNYFGPPSNIYGGECAYEIIEDPESESGQAIYITRTANTKSSGPYWQAPLVVPNEPYELDVVVKGQGTWKIGHERMYPETFHLNENDGYIPITKSILSREYNYSAIIFYETGWNLSSYLKISKIELYHLLPNTSKSGSTFDGWWTKPDGGTRITHETTVTGNQIYYAHWTQN